MNTTEQEVLSVEDADLEYVRAKRTELINISMKAISEEVDPKYIGLALSALADMDRASLGRKKIKVEEKATNNQEGAAAIICELLKRASGTNPFMVTDLNQAPRREIPTLGTEVPSPILVPGETGTDIVYDTCDDFRKRLGID